MFLCIRRDDHAQTLYKAFIFHVTNTSDMIPLHKYSDTIHKTPALTSAVYHRRRRTLYNMSSGCDFLDTTSIYNIYTKHTKHIRVDIQIFMHAQLALYSTNIRFENVRGCSCCC